MKIAILIHHYLPKWQGGAEEATAHLAHYLAARNHDVHIITSLDGGLPKEGVESGVHVHRIHWPNLRLVGFVLFGFKFLSTVRRIDPHVILVQGISLGLFGFFAKRILKKPYVAWGHGEISSLHYLFKKQINTVVLKDADVVIALTDDMKKVMQRYCSRNISVIPNGVEVKPFEQITRETARRRLGINETEKIVLFVGSLYLIKGIRYLIEAMPRITQTEPNARLLLVGDGEQRESLERLVGTLQLLGRVFFAGRVPHDRVPTFMAASDLFVLPSLSEGLPIVILEAMAAALPIVATNVGGVPSIVKDGASGFLVNPRNPVQIADSVSFILSDPELRQNMSGYNKNEVMRYTWKNVVDDFERVLVNYVKLM